MGQASRMFMEANAEVLPVLSEVSKHKLSVLDKICKRILREKEYFELLSDETYESDFARYWADYEAGKLDV